MLVAGEKIDPNTPEIKVRQNLNFSKMKKLILSLTGMGIALALVFASCQKEEIRQKVKDSTLASNKTIDSPPEYEKVGGGMFVTHWNGNDCVKPAKECTDVVVITPLLSSIIEEVDDNQNDYDYERITDLVSNHKEIFQELFGDQITYDLENGECRIEARINSNKSFLLISDSEGEIFNVRPFIQ